MTTSTITLRQIHAANDVDMKQLNALLIDVVHGNASIGFLAPLAEQDAEQYWTQVLASLGAGLQLWIAENQGEIVGSVQLAPCQKSNGRHRADLQKLMVKPSQRGLGISSRLVLAAENHAKNSHLSLLVLDTEAGSLAESMYQHWGWQKTGEIPHFALTPTSKMHATAVYYKLI
jgi:GNAT superfamily N-acetyltransferase